MRELERSTRIPAYLSRVAHRYDTSHILNTRYARHAHFNWGDKTLGESLPDQTATNYKHALLKVPISCLGILHIYNIWNHVIRIAIYLVVRKFYLRGLFGC